MRFIVVFFYLLNFSYARAADCAESFNGSLNVQLVVSDNRLSDSNYYAEVLKLKVGEERLIGPNQSLSLKEGFDLLQQLSENEIVLVTFQGDLKKAGEKKLKMKKTIAENKIPPVLLKIGDFLSNYNPWALADKFSGLGSDFNTVKEIEDAKKEVKEILRTGLVKVNDYEIQRTFVITKHGGELKFFLQHAFSSKWASADQLFSIKSETPPGIVSIKAMIP